MKISKSELKTIIRETLREELEKLNPFVNKETGERLFVADDSEGGGIIAAVWAKSDLEAVDFIWDYASEFSDRAHIMLGSEYYDSFEEFAKDFPDLAEGEGGEVCDGFDRDPDRYYDAWRERGFWALD